MITASVDASVFNRRLDKLRSDVRTKTVSALNWTIYNVRDAHRAAMSNVFDRPTAFTLNQSNLVKPATDKSTEATTMLRNDQSSGTAPSRYLRPSVVGGQRAVKPYESALQQLGLMPKGWVSIPGNGAKLDSFGNMQRGQITQILSALGAAEQRAGYSANRTDQSALRNRKSRDYFVSTPSLPNPRGVKGRLPFGVYQRTGPGRIVTVLRYRNAHQYDERFDYVGIAARIAQRDFERNLRKAVDQINS